MDRDVKVPGPIERSRHLDELAIASDDSSASHHESRPDRVVVGHQYQIGKAAGGN